MGDNATIRAGDVGSAPVCKSCGSGRVVKSAWACWNPGSGLWELETTFDRIYCHACESETTLDWIEVALQVNRRVQELNDAFRKDALGTGSLLVTRGIADQGEDFTHRTVAAVQAFDTFTEDNDPYGEHDFGAIEIDGQKIFWKIDCYDQTREYGSPNPGNPALTHRVLTIMLANEY